MIFHFLHFKWNGLKPIFVDIQESDFNIDPIKIEKSITEKTSAILPVHVYGNPCNIIEIKKIANSYQLKLKDYDYIASGSNLRFEDYESSGKS